MADGGEGFGGRFEVVARARGNRRWPDDVKARIVAETLLPGATVNGVAAKYAVRPNHVSGWRRRARDGELVLPALEAQAEFAPLVLFDEGPRLHEAEMREPVALIDILPGDVTIRLDGGTPVSRVVDLVRGLRNAT